MNSCSHSGISEYNGLPSSIVASFFCVFGFYWLGFHQVALIYHQPNLTLALEREMSLSIRSSRSRVCISLTVGEEDEVEEDDEE